MLHQILLSLSPAVLSLPRAGHEDEAHPSHSESCVHPTEMPPALHM